MKDKVFLMVKLLVETNFANINDAIKELETQTNLSIPSTPNVTVLKTEIMQTQRGNPTKS